MHDVYFILLHISVVLVSLIMVYILRMSNKKQIHYVFVSAIVFMLIWSTGNLLEAYIRMLTGKTPMALVCFWYIGICFTPVMTLLIGIVFGKTKINFFKYYIYLFIPPLVSCILVFTNSYHHLFFVRFSPINSEVVYGTYFIFHSIYSYACMVAGIVLLMYYSIKNSRFFSKQSMLIAVGSIVPLVVNILVTLKLVIVPAYTTAISFSFAMLCIAVAIFRYNFLSVAPVALHTVVDRISDSFMVVNEEYKIVDFNKTMAVTFKGHFPIYRNKDLRQVFKDTCLIKEDVNLISAIEKAQKEQVSIVFEKHIEDNGLDKYFTIEATPIILKNNYLGTVILFKDITQNKKDIATIEEKHAIMMEQERLASLGQLIGGIAHNLKTPIMSISGTVEALRDLITEYDQSIGDASVTDEDHHEIAAEMNTWLDKIKPYCSYMSDIIDTVKGQAVQFNKNSTLSFTVNELIKRIELLMKYELIRYNCKLNTRINVNYHTEMYGDVNSLVQVFDNIIMNAIHAYEGQQGTIDFIVEKQGEDIRFIIKDYAKGIPDNVKGKLLKEMITTKGKNGTGLGLYMSHSTIKGHFGGKMWFESAEGKGTTFYIQLPHRLTA
ncbi:MAG: ATP-binding protein [Clostridia bacterium]|nr:ATP-binding protein [Clostridia bacterium]